MTTQTIEQAVSAATLSSPSLATRLAVGAVCATLGLGLLAGIGFAGSVEIHNAAHDTRHAVGFPCH